MTKKTYKGSCHCGKVSYEADLDLSQGSGKCNCSICTKGRFWGVMAKPADFRLLSGEEDLTDYTFNSKAVHHLFCKHCGVRSFGRGDIPEAGGAFVSVNLTCLDDVDPADLTKAPVGYSDGRNNAWHQKPAFTDHL